jgi:hypothetical protein
MGSLDRLFMPRSFAAPLAMEDALEMIAELKTSALFDAWRGGPQYDKKSRGRRAGQNRHADGATS